MDTYAHRPEINVDVLINDVMSELDIVENDLHIPIDMIKIPCTYWTELMLTPLWRFIISKSSDNLDISDNEKEQKIFGKIDGLFGLVLAGYFEKKSFEEYKGTTERFVYHLSKILLKWSSGKLSGEYWEDYRVGFDTGNMYLNTDYDPQGVLLAALHEAVYETDPEKDTHIFRYIFPLKTGMRITTNVESTSQYDGIKHGGWWSWKRFLVWRLERNYYMKCVKVNT